MKQNGPFEISESSLEMNLVNGIMFSILVISLAHGIFFVEIGPCKGNIFVKISPAKVPLWIYLQQIPTKNLAEKPPVVSMDLISTQKKGAINSNPNWQKVQR